MLEENAMRENAALAAAQVDGFGQLPEHVAFAGQFFGKLFRSQGLGCEVSLLHHNFLNFGGLYDVVDFGIEFVDNLFRSAGRGQNAMTCTDYKVGYSALRKGGDIFQ